MPRALLTLCILTVLSMLVALPAALLGLVHPFDFVRILVARVLSRSMLWTCGVRLVVEDERGSVDGPPAFFVGNHQSAADIPTVSEALKGRAFFMAKHSLFLIPALGWFWAVYGYASIHRSDPRRTKRNLDRMIERVRARPASWVVFPEGTRSTDGRLLPFRRGTMKICARAGLPIVPFAVDGSARVHRARVFRVHPGLVRVIFGEPIPAETVSRMSSKELSEMVQQRVADCLDRARSMATSGDQGGDRSA